MKLIRILCLVLLGLILDSAAGEARVGVIIGQPYYYYPPYYSYYPPIYAYPNYYYSPSYASPVPAPAPYDTYYHDEETGLYCREYTRRVRIGGQQQEAYGHACRQPDGRWKIVD